MKKILILSATGNTNYTLAKNILKIINDKTNVELKNLEEFNLPIFYSSTYEKNKVKYFNEIELLTKMMTNADGLIFCSPEYNGSIPPIVTNAIAWISVTTDYWRDGFNNKVGLIATSSGGNASKLVIALKNQLEHLGMVVMPRSINVSSNSKFNLESAEKILAQFIKLI